MSILLDTNTLVWLLSSNDEKKFGPQTKKLIQNASTVYASSVSILEIRIKEMLNKLSAPKTLIQDIMVAGLKDLPFNGEHADAVRDFPDLRGHDPFDRMLLAQAKVEQIHFLTSDKFLIDQKINFVLDAHI
jgi:PIN domain nuclease of toxin-antitoxin system